MRPIDNSAVFRHLHRSKEERTSGESACRHFHIRKLLFIDTTQIHRMRTILVLQCSLILIISSVSCIPRSAIQSRGVSSEADHVSKWRNYNKWLKNKSHFNKNDKDDNSLGLIFQNIQQPVDTTVVKKPAEINVGRTFRGEGRSVSNDQVFTIVKGEIIIKPSQPPVDYELEKCDNVPHAERNNAYEPSQPDDDVTAKTNETLRPSNKTKIIDDEHSENRGNCSKGYKEDSKQHEYDPYTYTRKGKVNVKPVGNCINKTVAVGQNDDGASKPSQDANSDGEKPNVTGESRDTTAKNDETHAPSNKTEIEDDILSEHQSKHLQSSPESDEDSKDEDSLLIIHTEKGKSESTHDSDSTRKTIVTGQHDDGSFQPSQNANLNSEKPNVTRESYDTIAKNNGTHAPLNKTEVVDDKTSKNQDESKNTSTNKTNEQSNSEINSYNSTRQTGAVTLDDDYNGLYEITSSDNDTTIPEFHETFDEGDNSQSASAYFIE